MKVSLNWLKNYIDVDLPVEKLVDGLIHLGFDIESYENEGDKLKGFVIGKVVERKKHPNADKLSVCKVDIGTGELLNIVCGAPNVNAGQTVCVAQVGAIIPNGEFELKKAKIRGEFSEGMICSEREMNLGDDQSGIMVLEDKLPLGSPFAEYLGSNDVVLDIGITPNRGDLLSHIGVAREVGVLTGNKVKIPEIKLNESKSKTSDFISIEIENPDGCYRYCGRLVKNVKIKPSPDWMQKYLISAGLRPINNIVDITNFVMLECGQPLHAFDYDLIEGKKIVVKDSKDTPSFTTLDGKERKLREDILFICDAKKPVALAGIMGGENSEITEKTKNVFIESAYFDPIRTRKSSKFLSLQTDSSYRFERGIDIDKTPWACSRAAELIAEYGGGEITFGLIDEYPKHIEQKSVGLRLSYLNRIIGIEFEKEQVKELLEKIDIEFIEEKNNTLFFNIPSFRVDDLQREIDLIEEVARIYGYSNIPDSDYDQLYYDTREYDEESTKFISDLRIYLVSRGFKEIITNTLVNEKRGKIFTEKNVQVLNPFSIDMNVVRSNLYLGALEAVKNNFNFKAQSLKLFEVGDVMKYSDAEGNLIPGIEEDKRILLTIAGEYDLESVSQKSRSFDIFDLKGELQVLLEKLHIDNYKLNDYNYSEIFDFSTEFSLSGKVFARIFKFNSKCLKIYDIDKDVYGCEIYLNVLSEFAGGYRKYEEISKYPPVLRDLSIIASKDTKIRDLEEQIKSSSGKLLKKLRLYDIYSIDNEKSGKTSFTFSLEFSSNEKTLTDEEVNRIQDKIVNDLKKKLKAELRV
jgi:phenylalanyl-tRNA synthetase beta chain